MVFDDSVRNNIYWHVFILGQVRSVTRSFAVVSHIVYGSALPCENVVHGALAGKREKAYIQ